MTDLDKIKVCARAMGVDALEREQSLFEYNPLENSAQADALEGWLLERGWIQGNKAEFIFAESDKGRFRCKYFTHCADMTKAENRRRARVECVAKMMEQK